MKIGIVGLGHWGKVILRNLRELGHRDIVVCEQRDVDWHEIGEKYRQVRDYRKLSCDAVFVIVPVASHYEVCRHFLERGIDVFCEKPLDTNLKHCQKLYEISDKHNSRLFVDWLFTYNPAVQKIKTLIGGLGKPKSIIANRMNFGPVRTDVNARWDLASHDVSIGCYLLDEAPVRSEWLDFKRDKNSDQDDSTVGVLEFSETSMQINASWSYGMKNRMYILEFNANENSFLHWDDNTSTILYGNDVIPIEPKSPLHSSITNFLNGDWGPEQKDLSLHITGSLYESG